MGGCWIGSIDVPFIHLGKLNDFMSIDSNDLRDALRPQDGLAALITLLGIAIAIFLPDSVVKLIGGCIAVLGGIALYMTLRGRVNDRVRIKQKRTTLPPPSFKTRVTTDPKTSARRIRFDDFQETFNVDDANEEQKASAPPSNEGRAPHTDTANAELPKKSLRFDDFGMPSLGDTADVSEYDPTAPTPIEGEGFRIVGAKESLQNNTATAAQTGGAVAQRDNQEQKEGAQKAPSTSTQVPPIQVKYTQPDATPQKPSSATTGSEAEPQGRKSKKKKRGAKRQSKADSRSENRSDNAAATSPQKAPTQSGVVAPATPVQPTQTSEKTTVKNTATVSAKPVAGSLRSTSQETAQGTVRQQIQMVLDELSPDGDAEPTENEPRAEFVRLVDQVLKAVARSIEGRSIIFFWVNQVRGHFIPEAFVTQKGLNVRLGERIKIGNDLVSQIARGGVPEIITNISQAAEQELTPYYTNSAGTTSFVGVPVYFRHEVVGVLAADSSEESSFDEASVATLAEYTLLISQLIRGYTEKFDLYLMRQSVEAFERLHQSLTATALSPERLADLLVENLASMFDADYVAVILYNREAAEWRVVSCQADSDVLRKTLCNLRPDMRNSVAGEAARQAEEIYLPKTGDNICIVEGEPTNRNGSFLAVPLMAATKCYGSVVLGHASADAWVPRDIDLIRDLSRYVAMAIEVVNTNQALEEQMVFDEETGLYNSAFFLSGFDREIDRAQDFKVALSFALIAVDAPTTFAPDRAGEIARISVSEVGAILAKKLRPYDLLGRFDKNVFSVALIGRSDQEAYLWAERLRKEIAGHIIPFESRTFSVTVSAGISDATSSSDKSQIINGARQALEKAGKDGGNTVVIY